MKNDKMIEQDKELAKRQSEEIDKLVSGSYYTVTDEGSKLIYGYIESIKPTQPGAAAYLEIKLLEKVPQDSSIRQRIDELYRVIKENPVI